MNVALGLNDYFRILNKRKWIVVSVFSLTLASTVFYTEIQTPLYSAQAIIKYEAAGTRMFAAESGPAEIPDDIDAEINRAKAPDLAEAAARKLSWPIDRVLGAYKAQRVEQSNLIALTSVGTDPEATAQLVNVVAQTYVESDLVIHSRQARKTVEDVTARQQEIGSQLQALEVERQKFQESHQTLGLSANLAGRLLELQTSRKELLKKYTPEHPDIIKLDQTIEAARQSLASMPSQEMELVRINRDLKLNEDIYTTLSRRLEEAKIALASVVPVLSLVSRAAEPTRPVFPNKTVNYAVGGALGSFLGLMFAFVLESMGLSLATIEELEKSLEIPVLGIIPHFQSDLTFGQLVRQRLLRQGNSMEMFRSLLLFQHSAKSPFMEVYHTLRANIQAQLTNPQKMVLLFTSAGVAEGKTLTAVNFCLAAAHSGLKTLLVEADLRRPSIYQIFGTPPDSGFLEALRGKAPWQEYVCGTLDFLMGDIDLDKMIAFPGIENFSVMAGRTTTSHIVETLSGPLLPALVEQLRAHYDLVVFDCPPALLFVDPILIGTHCDGCVMIFKSGKMATGAFKRAKDQVVAGKCRMLGMVLNDMQATDMEPRYGYYYDYGRYAA